MNVTFHTLAAVATAAAMSSRERLIWSRIALGFAIGILLHGLLDFLPHRYPIASALDVAVSLCLTLVALVFLLPGQRPLVMGCFLGCISPDVIDLGPQLANSRLGLSLPVFKVFPWHWAQYSGSIYDQRHALTSALLHTAVVSVSLVVLAVKLWGKSAGNKSSEGKRDTFT